MYNINTHNRPFFPSALLAALMLMLASCGGGGNNGSGQPDPQPNYPDPVEELSAGDIANAGLPDINSLASISSKSGSMLEIPAENQLILNLSLGWDGVLASRNLASYDDGKGWQTSVDSSETGRVLAWAVYEIPATAESKLWQANYGASFSHPGLRLFHAVANQSLGGWEIGGRITDSVNGGGLHAVDQRFSQSEDYVMPNGSSYYAILVGHPGNGEVNGLGASFTTCMCTHLLFDSEAGFPDEEYSMLWEEDSFSVMLNDSTVTNNFNIGMPPTLNARLLVATDLEDQLWIAANWSDLNETDPGLAEADPAIHWFDNKGFNGPAHDYNSFLFGDGSVRGFMAGPLVDANGNGTANGIIAILIGLQGPIPGAAVNVYLDDIVIGNTTTDARGEFSLNGLDEGSYTLEIGAGSGSELTRELEVLRNGGILVGLLLPAVQK